MLLMPVCTLAATIALQVRLSSKCTPETALKVMLDKQLNFVDAVIEHVWYCASCPLSQFPYSASAEILRRLPLLSACVFSCVVTPGGLVVLKRFGFNYSTGQCLL